jgi:hypothetical protein
MAARSTICVEPALPELEPRARNVDGLAARLRHEDRPHGRDCGRHVDEVGGMLLVQVDRHGCVSRFDQRA